MKALEGCQRARGRMAALVAGMGLLAPPAGAASYEFALRQGPVDNSTAQAILDYQKSGTGDDVGLMTFTVTFDSTQLAFTSGTFVDVGGIAPKTATLSAPGAISISLAGNGVVPISPGDLVQLNFARLAGPPRLDSTPNLAIDIGAGGIYNTDLSVDLTWACFPSSFTWQDPLQITLTSFSATATAVGSPVSVDWTTSSETNNSGFNVYQGTGAPLVPGPQLNGTLIASNGSAGAVYSFPDLVPIVDGSEVRSYFLEDIDLLGHRNMFGPVSTSAVGPPAGVADWTAIDW